MYTLIDKNQYKDTADKLENRIFNLIEDNRQILTIQSPFDLFDIPGFNCEDLNPSLNQAMYALEAAKKRFKNIDLKSSS